MTVSDLPAINATLNGTAAVLLVFGYYFIRGRKIRAHRACMISAFAVSTVFLISYLAYHFEAGVIRFPLHGWIRPVYFTILTTHTILAGLVPFLAIVTLSRGLRRQFPRHRRIARWTLPIWLYVSVTGVIVYWMLYQLAGAA